MDVVSEVAGWAGAAAILSAYLLVSMGWLRAGRRFQTANLVEACAFIINGAYHGAWPSAVTNIVWFLISVAGLLRILRKGDATVSITEQPPETAIPTTAAGHPT